MKKIYVRKILSQRKNMEKQNIEKILNKKEYTKKPKYMGNILRKRKYEKKTNMRKILNQKKKKMKKKQI